MPHYRRVGQIPPKRHIQFRRDDGGLFAEELMGTDGFAAESALLYHQNPPTALLAAEPAGGDEPLTAPEPLLPRHFRTHDLPVGEDLVTGRSVLAGNADLRIAYGAAELTSPLFRDATGDELVFVESGEGALESVFGPLPVRGGDYVVVPAGVTHRWVVTAGPLRALIVTSMASHLSPPARYLTARGQFLEGTPYCERDVRGPETPSPTRDSGPVDVLVRRATPAGHTTTRYTYAHHPFDVVGWDGCLYPWALSVHDLAPITGALHMPPPTHQTFEARGFMVTTFVPRILDFHPEAVPAPYNHSNVDSDEVLFYVDGNFTSRVGSGIGPGSISLHPAGFVHGPQPGATEASLGTARVDELAVMVDTYAPLQLAPAAATCEDVQYAWSWSREP